MPVVAPHTPDLLENEWQEQILDLCRYTGWRWYHPYDSRKSVAGWPDLVLCRPPRVLFVELKTRTGRITPAQQEWLDLLAACGAETYVWRPADLDQVRAILARRP